jgi:hypothetical protein
VCSSPTQDTSSLKPRHDRGFLSLPPPALAERNHGGLARCRVPVVRRALPMIAKGQSPHLFTDAGKVAGLSFLAARLVSRRSPPMRGPPVCLRRFIVRPRICGSWPRKSCRMAIYALGARHRLLRFMTGRDRHNARLGDRAPCLLPEKRGLSPSNLWTTLYG